MKKYEECMQLDLTLKILRIPVKAVDDSGFNQNMQNIMMDKKNNRPRGVYYDDQ